MARGRIWKSLPGTCKLRHQVDWLVELLVTQCSDLWTVNSRIRVTIYSCNKNQTQNYEIGKKVKHKRYNRSSNFIVSLLLLLWHCFIVRIQWRFFLSSYLLLCAVFFFIHWCFFSRTRSYLLVSRPQHRLRKLHFSSISLLTQLRVRIFFCYLAVNDKQTIKISV